MLRDQRARAFHEPRRSRKDTQLIPAMVATVAAAGGADQLGVQRRRFARRVAPLRPGKQARGG